VLIGFGNFVCHLKYNKKGEKLLNCLAVKEEESVCTSSKSRKDAQRVMAEEKKTSRTIEVANPRIFGQHGLRIDSRLQIIKEAKIEKASKQVWSI